MRLIANSSGGVLIRDYGEHHVTVLAPTVTPSPPTDTPMVAAQTFEETVLLLGDRVIALGALQPHELGDAHIALVWEAKPEVVIMGITDPMLRLSAAQRALFLGRGIGLETMTLGAACRTYSVLASDGRSAAALLFPAPKWPKPESSKPESP